MVKAFAFAAAVVLAAACGTATAAQSTTATTARTTPATTSTHAMSPSEMAAMTGSAAPTGASSTAAASASTVTTAANASATVAATSPVTSAPATSAAPTAAATIAAPTSAAPTSAPPTPQPTVAPTPPPPAGPATTVTVTLIDTGIRLSTASVPAGTVTFLVTNAGTTPHELEVLRTNIAQNQLPPDPTNPAIVQMPGLVGGVASLQPKTSGSVTLSLAAGAYVLICNEPAHYSALGMHIAFTVN